MTASANLRSYLDFAVDAAWQAGQLTLARFQTGIAVERKADGSAVTEADRASEQLLRRLIGQAFPDHAVLGEEYGESPARGGARWILDPIDGTASFVQGVPLYAVLVGLEIEGDAVVGVAYFPALDEMVAAARGLGCSWNGRRARVSTVDRLEDAVLTITDPGDEHGREEREAMIARTGLQRGWGDAYGHALVATGRAEIALDPVVNPWDCAALIPILQEAGGTFTAWDGRVTIEGGNAVSTNGLLFDAVTAILQAD